MSVATNAIRDTAPRRTGNVPQISLGEADEKPVTGSSMATTWCANPFLRLHKFPLSAFRLRPVAQNHAGIVVSPAPARLASYNL